VTAAGGTYLEIRRRWEAIRGKDLHLHELASGVAGRALLCADFGDPARPAVAISAGLHGDEPAGPWALLELMEARELDSSFCYRIWPCINVSGFAAGTRVNADGVDINRTFDGIGTSPEARVVLAANRSRRFQLSLDLHEDCDAVGFYCYEYGGDGIGPRVIATLESAGFPIDPLDTTFDLAGPLDDAHCVREHGRLVADALHEQTALGGLSYSMAISRDGAPRALTFETPSSARWQTRLAMQRAAVLSAIAALAEESASAPFK
jgi:murein peptide amidase A